MNNDFFGTGFLIGVIFVMFLTAIIPINYTNTIEVNSEACHIAIKKKYPHADIKFIRKISALNRVESQQEIIYLINNKFTENCVTGGKIYTLDNKRRIISINELLGVK